MRRLFWPVSSLSLPAIIIIASLIIPVFAAADVEIYSEGVNASGEQVIVSYTGPFNYGPCASAGARCQRFSATIHVTPCPPGVPCVGGSHTFTVGDPSEQVPFLLEFGTTYTFTGDWKREIGYVPFPEPCVYTCLATGSLGSTSYHSIDGQPYWQITPVSSDENTMVVDAVLKNFNVTSCLWFSCGVREHVLTIEPCILEIDGETANCINGKYSRIYGALAPHRITLLQDQVYTFGGSAIFRGLAPEMGSGSCAVPSGCEWVGTNRAVEFNATPLATTPSTWGSVKAMYRSP
jgi:hypothetical protein